MRIATRFLACAGALVPLSSVAQLTAVDPPTLRLVKSPDAKDVSKPATLGYQHNDGSKSDYFTEGAVKVDLDFGANKLNTLSPSVSWNHNTLATTPTNNWAGNLGLISRWLYQPAGAKNSLDAVNFSASVGQLRDVTKTSNATTLKAGATLYSHHFEIEPNGTTHYGYLRPTVSVFEKHVTSAAADKTTGIRPTGTMSGESISLDATALWNRWTAKASSQVLRTEKVVQGDAKGTHYLHSMSLTYVFLDSPTTVDEQKRTVVVPGLTLSRQVGDDPLNAIPKAGFTQLAFTLKY